MSRLQPERMDIIDLIQAQRDFRAALFDYFQAQTNRAYAYADLRMADVELGDLFTFSVRAYPKERFSGRVRQINDFIDPQTRTVKVRGEITDPSRRLKAQMYVTAELRLHEGSGLQMPEQAAVLIGDSYYVFVAEGEHTYRRRKI